MRDTDPRCSRFIAELARFSGAKKIVEFGCLGGATTKELCERTEAVVLAYDIDVEYCEKTKTRCPRADVLNEDVLSLDDESVYADFAFIDIEPKGSYYAAFSKLLVPKHGIVCAHDTLFGGDTGAKGFPDFLSSMGYDVINFPLYHGLCVGMKNHEG